MEIKEKREVESKVDECIISLCNKIQNGEFIWGELSSMVNAVSEMMKARELMRSRERKEETLQSIDATLKRIEKILIDQTRPTEVSINIADGKKGEKRWEQRKTE